MDQQQTPAGVPAPQPPLAVVQIALLPGGKMSINVQVQDHLPGDVVALGLLEKAKMHLERELAGKKQSPVLPPGVFDPRRLRSGN